jgi:hypothetical protein
LRPVIRLVVLIVLLLGAHRSQAQLHVFKDVLNCTYGLKNDSGEWVVPPFYLDIQQLYRGYSVFNGVGYGYLSDSGKLVIPPVFEFVNDKDLYQAILVGLNGKWGAFTYAGKELIPPEYTVIGNDAINVPAENRQIVFYTCYTDSNETVYSSLRASDGRVVFRNVPGYVVGFYNRYWLNGDHPYSILQRSQQETHANLGIIDTNGQVIIPPLYDQIYSWNAYFTARRNGLITILDNENRALYPPVRSLISSSFRYPSFYCGENETYVLQLRDSTYTLVDGQFRSLVPDYDSIRPSGIRFPTATDHCYQVFSGGKTGLIDATGKTILPLTYEELTPLVCRDSYNHGYCHAHKLSFLFRLKGSYGVLDDSLQQVIPPKYDLPEGNLGRMEGSCYLQKGKDLFFVASNENEPLIRKLDYLFTKDSTAVYRDRNKVISLGKNRSGRAILRNSNYLVGDLVHLPPDRWFDRKGRELYPGRIRYLNAVSPKLVLLQTRSGNHGVISIATGKLVIDTVFRELTYDWENRLLWGTSAAGKWYLFDTLGRLRTPLVFDTLPNYYYDHNYAPPRAIAVATGGFRGIADRNYRLIVPAVYRGAAVLSEDCYVVVSQGNKIGLADSNNRLLADTVYTDFRPVFGNYSPELDYERETGEYRPFPDAQKEFWWLLSAGEKRLLVCNRGQSVASETATDRNAGIIDSMLTDFALKGVAFWYHSQAGQYVWNFRPDGSQNILEGAFRVYQEQDSIVHLPYRDALLSLLRAAYEREIPQYHKNGNPKPGFTTREIPLPDTLEMLSIFHAKKRYVSLIVSTTEVKGLDFYNYKQNYGYILWHIADGIRNYIEASGRLKAVSLTDIFGNGSVLQEELLLALSLAGSDDKECHSTEELVRLHSAQFSLSPEGVWLHEQGEYHTGLLVPLERLAAKKETRWIVPYLQ